MHPDYETLIDELRKEAELCDLETAHDVADLLNEAADALAAIGPPKAWEMVSPGGSIVLTRHQREAMDCKGRGWIVTPLAPLVTIPG